MRTAIEISRPHGSSRPWGCVRATASLTSERVPATSRGTSPGLSVPTGRVWALDTDGEAIFFMQQREKREPFPFANVTIVESRNDSITLPPNSIDWAFFCESHFYLEEQDTKCVQCLKSVFEAVRPGGRLAVIEARSDNVRGEVSKSWLARPFLTCGFKHVGSYDFLATEHFEIFEKPGRASALRAPERTGAR